MSRYTTELRYPLLQGYDIGLKHYEIFNESYREILNSKIINHFYFREIGYTTWERFKFALNQKMIEIMPYYNKLYNLEFDELIVNRDIRITEDNSYNATEITGFKDNLKDQNIISHKNQSNNTGDSKGITSDTPMGKLNDIFSKEYATGTTQNIDASNSQEEYVGVSVMTHDDVSENNRKYDKGEDKSLLRKGYEGNMTKGELILKYKDIFFNIDMLVIKDLESLFMGVW